MTNTMSQRMHQLSDEIYDYMPSSPTASTALRIVESNLKHHNDMNPTLEPLTPVSVDENGETLLFHLVRFGIVPAAHVVWEMGADLKHVNTKGQTLVHAALEANPITEDADTHALTMLKWLAAQQLDLNAQDALGRTPLFALAPALQNPHGHMFGGVVSAGEPRLYQELIDHAIYWGADMFHRDHEGNTFVPNNLPSSVAQIFDKYSAALQKEKIYTVVDRIAARRQAEQEDAPPPARKI